MRLAALATQGPDRRVVAVDLVGLQHVAADRLGQRAQQLRGLADPVGQRGAVQVQASAGVDLALAVQRGMVAVLADQHLGQQPGAGQESVHRPARGLGLGDGLAAAAHQLGPYMADDMEAAGLVVEHLADVLADLAQGQATGGAAAAGLVPGRPVHHGSPRQVRRQFTQVRARPPSALAAMLVQRGDVAARFARRDDDNFPTHQLELRVFQPFAGAAVLHAPQVGDFELELVNRELRTPELVLEVLHLRAEFGVALQGFVQVHEA